MKNLLKCLLVGLLPVLVPVSLQAQTKACPLVKMEAERLPDLNTARAGHQTFCVMGQLTVVGGHTNGFVLTPTASPIPMKGIEGDSITYYRSVIADRKAQRGVLLPL